MVIISILLLGTIDMTSVMFNQQAIYNNDVQAKQAKNISNERILSKIREAASVYNENVIIDIPLESSTYKITTGEDSIAVMVPKFDSTGNVSQPTSTSTNFTGIAFSIIPESNWNGKSNGKYVLIETNFDITLNTTAADPLKITQSLPLNWTSGESYLIAENLEPANLSYMGQKAFDIEGDLVTFAFVPNPNCVYFGSPDGSKTINDKPFLASTQFRNYRVK